MGSDQDPDLVGNKFKGSDNYVCDEKDSRIKIRNIAALSLFQSLQIAGRAGRFGTQWETGYVTTFKEEELKPLKGT